MNSESNVDYKEFINVIKRGRWTILLITLLLTVVATSISYYSMKTSKASYETKTSIIIGKKEDIGSAKKTISTFEQIAGSSTISKNISAALKGAITAEEVKNSYEITVADDAPILTITASGKTQNESTKIASAVSVAFANEVVRIYPTETIKIMEDSVQTGISNSTFKFKNVILASLLGVFLSTFIVTFKGFFDESIRTKEDVEKYLKVDVIGKLSKTKQKEINIETNNEEFNELKANIQFQSANKKSKVIMISSADKNEGRSTTAAYLSKAFAQSGKKTMLVDCDLRNSNIHNLFDLKNDDRGLVNFLSGDIKFEQVLKTTKQKNLSVVTSGSKSSNYAELLVSTKFNEFLEKLKEDFDYIILDTPPLTQGADAEAISKNAEACVLVIKDGQTERKTAIKAKDILEKANANIIGVCLNKTN
jgi:capsular exopolysaccharide synthesis family protein